jgi:hypothetical protein
VEFLDPAKPVERSVVRGGTPRIRPTAAEMRCTALSSASRFAAECGAVLSFSSARLCSSSTSARAFVVRATANARQSLGSRSRLARAFGDTVEPAVRTDLDSLMKCGGFCR